MAITQAGLGYGSLLKVGDGQPTEVFTTLLEVTSIDGPTITADQIDVTHMESPSGFREYIAGLKDGGEISGEGNLVLDATQQGVIDDLQAGTKRNFKLVLPVNPTDVTFEFAGVFTEFSASAPVDAQMTYSFNVKISGAVTITP